MESPIMNQFNNFKQNPFQFLLQHKINIPNEYANNPQGAVQYGSGGIGRHNSAGILDAI